MSDTGLRLLRLLDRALRPTAAAVRVSSRATAETNSLIRDLAAELRAQTELLRTLQASTVAESAEPPVTEKLEASAEPSSVRADASAVGGAAPAAPATPESDVVGPQLDIPLNALYDQWTAEVIAKVLADGGTGVDVGAHHGDILQSIVASAPDSHHYAFEPIPHMADDLKRRYPAVSVHQLALADADGATQFHHVVSNPAYSGILRRHYDRPDEAVQLIDVQIRRLDEILDPADPVRLIKIDVEGAELGVLKGAQRTLGTYRPVVVFEFGLGASDVYGTTPAMVHELFSGHGMVITLLDRWLTGGDPLSLDEFEQEYRSGSNYYFLAAPAPEPAEVS